MKPESIHDAAVTPPAWCSNALRLLSSLGNVGSAVVGFKLDGTWRTFTDHEEALPPKEIVRACEIVAGNRIDPTESGDPVPAFAGAPLLDPDGVVAGALIVFAPEGAELEPSVPPIINELAGLLGPFVTASPNGAEDAAHAAITFDPAFMVRVFGKIQPRVSEIVALSDVLQKEIIGTSRKRAEIIYKNSTQVIRTLKSVLDLVELESGVAPTLATITDLDAVAREVLERHRPDIRKRGLRLEFVGTEERVEAEVDEGVLRQILGILLANAIQYTDEGSISIIVDKTDSEARITVRDTGRGIREEFLPKLFKPFSSDDQESARNDSAIGMGLALAVRLAGLIDSSITVDSRPGQGSSFTLHSPLLEPGGDTVDVPPAGVELPE